MKIGVCVSNFFFRKVTGNPMHDAVYEDGALKEMRYLSIDELKRATGNVLEYAVNLGIEAIEVYQTLERLEAMLSSLKDRGDMELTLHECNAELWYPGSMRISSRNPQIRKVVTENLKWLIDMAEEVRARAIVLHPASFDNSAKGAGGFGSENIFGFEEARGDEITIVLENEASAGAGYEEEWEKLKSLKAAFT